MEQQTLGTDPAPARSHVRDRGHRGGAASAAVTPGPTAPPRAGLRTRGPWRRVTGWVLTVLAVLALALVAASATGVVRLAAVTSSSMVPTLQVGDLVVTHPVPAADAVVGDIVTLVRPDGEQVTHRVLANDPAPDGHGRLIAMRGDGNTTADAAPYPVDTVDELLVRVPAVGGVVLGLAQSGARWILIGCLALLAVASLLPGRRRTGRQ